VSPRANSNSSWIGSLDRFKVLIFGCCCRSARKHNEITGSPARQRCGRCCRLGMLDLIDTDPGVAEFLGRRGRCRKVDTTDCLVELLMVEKAVKNEFVFIICF
jgi:hypothetical protein